ncbi:hypothetical protein CYMTET_54519 [Cymbomonas tetramitiformis]|uniref:Uncharacterized protein n=1 Tax=Cymbomonas tetramitiformis TaxID=36881 RepID=A0AAE0EP92_9CHLO|nr:hypothetical protein CYMTET_54519 [Cymbomonas tetramitiformis]
MYTQYEGSMGHMNDIKKQRIRAIAIFPFTLHHITRWKHFWIVQSCNLTACDVKEKTSIVWLSKVFQE